METFTIAGPLAQTRKFQTSLAAELPATARPVKSSTPVDPSAPAGPRPTFQITPLERLRERPPVLPINQLDTALATRGAPEVEANAPVAPDTEDGAAPAIRQDSATQSYGDGASAPPTRAVDRLA